LRECRTIVLSFGTESRQEFEQLQTEGWLLTENDPGPALTVGQGQGQQTRLLTFCKD
jgi:hypothetical protein